MRIKLDLDQETTEKLVERSVSDRRPVTWQAEVLLRQALGLPFPNPVGDSGAWEDYNGQEVGKRP